MAMHAGMGPGNLGPRRVLADCWLSGQGHGLTCTGFEWHVVTAPSHRGLAVSLA